MKTIKIELLISTAGYILLIVGFILFIKYLPEGFFLHQVGFILCIAGLGTIIISYEILVRKLKSENHKLYKNIKKVKEQNNPDA